MWWIPIVLTVILFVMMIVFLCGSDMRKRSQYIKKIDDDAQEKAIADIVKSKKHWEKESEI